MIHWGLKWWLGALLVWSALGLIGATLQFSHNQSCWCVERMGSEWAEWCQDFQQEGRSADARWALGFAVFGPFALAEELLEHWPYCAQFTVSMVWQ